MTRPIPCTIDGHEHELQPHDLLALVADGAIAVCKRNKKRNLQKWLVGLDSPVQLVLREERLYVLPKGAKCPEVVRPNNYRQPYNVEINGWRCTVQPGEIVAAVRQLKKVTGRSQSELTRLRTWNKASGSPLLLSSADGVWYAYDIKRAGSGLRVARRMMGKPVVPYAEIPRWALDRRKARAIGPETMGNVQGPWSGPCGRFGRGDL